MAYSLAYGLFQLQSLTTICVTAIKVYMQLWAIGQAM
jgi:hypothetical protein